MPAIVANVVAALISKQGGGVSLTKVGAHGGGAAGVLATIGPALQGDPTSIGLLVLAGLSWAATIKGRIRADKKKG